MHGRRRLGTLAIGLAVLATCAVPVDAAAQPAGAITPQVAAERFELDTLAGALEADARRRFPDTFAGLWIDHDAGGTVSVAFSESAASKVATLARDFARPMLLRGVPAARSEDALRSILATLRAERAQTGGDYDLDLDVRRNVVRVLVRDEPDAATLAAFRQRFGHAVVVEQGLRPVTQAVCQRYSCAHSLRAGLQAEASVELCSLGFTVRRDSTGARDILSAGHCNETNRWHANVRYGSVVANQFSGRVDAERHSVDQGEFRARAWITYSGSDLTRPVTSKGTYADLAVGSTVCKVGITTGATCGTVQSKTFVPGGPDYPNGHYDMVQVAGMCSKGGDSGGAVIQGSGKAVGIHSGGDGNPNCNHSGEYAIFSHIEFVENQMNATVWTGESAPRFTSITPESLSTNVRINMDLPIRCDTVETADFTVKINGVPAVVAGETCGTAHVTNRFFDLVLGAAVPPGAVVTVSLVGAMFDEGGYIAADTTRSATAP